METELSKLFHDANAEFIKKDIRLILSWVNERTLCGALSQHIRDKLCSSKIGGYYVDVEYNRNQWKLKTIVDSNENIVSINCDIIVHSRWELPPDDNLLAIEMKKSTWRNGEKQKDRERLRALTKDSYDNIWSYDGTTLPEHVCGYLLGIYYEIDLTHKTILLEFYKKGELSDSQTINFLS